MRGRENKINSVTYEFNYITKEDQDYLDSLDPAYVEAKTKQFVINGEVYDVPPTKKNIEISERIEKLLVDIMVDYIRKEQQKQCNENEKDEQHEQE